MITLSTKLTRVIPALALSALTMGTLGFAAAAIGKIPPVLPRTGKISALIRFGSFFPTLRFFVCAPLTAIGARLRVQDALPERFINWVLNSVS